MDGLSLNFLDDEYSKNSTTYHDILEKYGTEICTYGSGYFDKIVATTEFEGEVKNVSLYILVPELSFEYKILHIDILNISNVRIALFSLTRNPAIIDISILNGLSSVEDKVKEYLGSNTANESLKLLVNKVNLKRKTNLDRESN